MGYEMPTFSNRNRALSNELIFDDAPLKLRIGICNIINQYILYLGDYKNIYNLITLHFQIERKDNINFKDAAEYFIKNALSWNQVYDLIELIYDNLSYKEWSHINGWIELPEETRKLRYNFTIDVNNQFKSCCIGWILRKGRIEFGGSELLNEELIKKAKLLLSNKSFENPNSQFNKALELLSRRPNPDIENSIKDAISAVEGILKILLGGKPKIKFGDGIKKLVNEGKIKKPLDEIFHALFGFASNAPGVRHGQPDRPVTSLPEAFFFIYTCAACIIYLCELFGYKPAENLEESKEDIPF